ncbi:MAG TPA: T9SS type A sorting domain-containing protein [Paludibacter sp.]
MKKHVLSLLLIVVVTFSLKAQTIILLNRGFESSLTNWTTSGTGVTYTIAATGAHSGSKMLKVDVTAVGSTLDPVKITHDPFETSSSRIYMVRFWAKASQPNSALTLNLVGATKTTSCKFRVDNVFGGWTNGWQMFQFLFKAPESPISMDLTFRTVGTYMIDDFEVLDDTQPVLDLKTQYMWQNNLKGFGWTSGDNDVSVLLPDGRTAWIFSDSFVGITYPGENYLRSSAMVNNIMVVQEGVNNDTLRSIYNGTTSNPRTLVTPPTSGNIYWVTDGIVENDTLKVMFNEWTGDFQNRAGVACFKLPELTFIKRTVPTYNHTDIPNALLADGDYVYIYMVQRTSNGFERFSRIARIPKGTMNNTTTVWEYYTTAGTWSTDFSLASRIISGVETGSVRKLGPGNYVMSGTPHLSLDIAVWYSPTPWGPWGNKKILYTRPNEEGILSYLGHMHECETTADGDYILSCSLYPFGGYVPQQINDKGTYLPIYIKANLKKWSPYTDLNLAPSEQKIGITLYPNPVSDVLSVEGVDRNENLEIYNLIGAKVKSAIGQTIDVNDLLPGVYVLKAKSQSKMFIKK